jgi:pantoate--beta-alanine ligase
MIICHSVEELNKTLSKARKTKQTIGFTPTMGALHDGHFGLIRRSIAENELSVCSIFVNPTQFNNIEDLEKYPRDLQKDAAGLRQVGCHILFAPSVKDIYPPDIDTSVNIDLQGLDRLMEGEHRPGHFAGVVQVVKRLLDIVEPSKLYMGQKDFQQFSIIRFMIRHFRLTTELVVCPTQREPSGLAMSSRNVRLTPTHKRDADIIYTVLSAAKNWLNYLSIKEIEEKAIRFMSIKGFKPEYFTIINGETLQGIDHVKEASEIVACTAVWAGNVRLIDNMTLR